MEDLNGPAGALRQKFLITIEWSPESDIRLTEGDVREAIEELAMDLDEEAVVEATETLAVDD